MATEIELTLAYAEIAADVTALKVIQVPEAQVANGYSVELVVAGSAPAANVAGIVLRRGETMVSAQIPDLGASGKLYGRIVNCWPNTAGSVRVL